MEVTKKCVDWYISCNALNNALSNKDVKFPAPIIIFGSRALKRISSEIEAYTKKRDELIQKYGEEENGVYTIKDQKQIKKFLEEIKEFDETEITIDIPTINIDLFGDTNYSIDEISPFELMVK